MVLVDICGTLYQSNTTFDFLDFYLRMPSYRRFRRISKTVCWRVLNRLCLWAFGYDLTRRVALSFLKGKTREELGAAAACFFDEFLCHKENREVIDRVASLQKEDTVLLVSATLDFIAATIAARLGIEQFYASQPAYREGVCCGYLRTDLLCGKAAVMRGIGIRPPYQWVITDNLSDLDLVREARSAWVIVYPRTRRRWMTAVRKYKLKGVSFFPSYY